MLAEIFSFPFQPLVTSINEMLLSEYAINQSGTEK
jgi:hypothetical protein